jgi:hypothetical protein
MIISFPSSFCSLSLDFSISSICDMLFSMATRQHHQQPAGARGGSMGGEKSKRKLL